MFDKRVLCIIFLLFMLIGTVSAVSANDLNQTDEIVGEVTTDEIISENPSSQVQKTFTDLNNDINGNDDAEIYLNHNYTFDPDFDANFRQGIEISREVTIWGNGHTIDAKSSAAIFSVTKSNVIFHDIVFTNGKSNIYGGAIDGKGTAVNCTFINNTADYGGAVSIDHCVNCSFYENTARYSGGAGTSANYENCIFIANSATDYGGAVYIGGNIRHYSVVNCTFVENHANMGGAINQIFDDVADAVNCTFIRNSAVWQAGAVYNGVSINCNFTENFADYGGAIYYGRAKNSTFTRNHAGLGGASYQSTCANCSFIENYADCGGAIYDGWVTQNCRFINNYADYGGAMYGTGRTVESSDFIYNFAKNGGATYQMNANDCYFAFNEATEYGGAMYGVSASDCIFKENKATISGNDTYNTIVSTSNVNMFEGNIIYFDSSASRDGDGSKDNPYKYFRADRIVPNTIAHFAKGDYELNGTCMIDNVKLVGGPIKIVSVSSNQYDFIIGVNSYLELKNIAFVNTKILNQGTLRIDDCTFTGNKEFDSNIKSASGLSDSSFGGAILCDAPNNIKTKLMIKGCTFYEIYDAFNGGVIAAINTDISIYNSMFRQYSATYKGGAIYCLNSMMDIINVRFNPSTRVSDDSFIADRYVDYTAYYGGSIYCENSQIKLERSSFVGSVAFSFGGCIGALNSSINSRDDYFNDSMSITDGGGVIYCSQGQLHIVNSKLYRNTAEFGGALCTLNSVLDSFRTWYIFNSANVYGGVIYDIYGSITLRTNLFGDSQAKVGGTIYTRIPNVFNVYSNSFATSFAERGSTIFFDGKKENIATSVFSDYSSIEYGDLMIPLDFTGLEDFNTFGQEYSVFAEFTATLNGEEYSIISNPVFYQISNGKVDDLAFPWEVYRVTDGLVSMKIYDLDDELRLLSVACGGEMRNVTAQINITEGFTNPVLKFYLLKGHNIWLNNYYGPDANNLYEHPRETLFKGSEYELIGNYTIDLSDNFDENTRTLTGNCSFDFGNPFLSINYDDLYDVGSFYPVSLVNSSFFNASSLTPGAGELSSYYNSNDFGFVSSVKNQGNGGNCWAFAGLATLETCLKKATGVTFDFSVQNAKNLMAAYSVFGLKIETNKGGYESMIMSYLTSWLGPIDQSIDDYDDYSSISLQSNPMFHIQNIKFLPARLNSQDNDLYKLAIRDNGAVSVTFKWGKEYHAVSLVGWNDNYKGNDSLGNIANGAWIFKNSWGPDWENNGFGYLSYDQKLSEQISPNMHAYTFIFNDINPYTKIYQYDYAGVSDFYHYENSIYFKNTFTAESDSLLSAYSTYFDRQTNSTVMVYVNDELVLTQNGIYQAGYYTIPLNTFVQLDKGDKFSIVVNNHGQGYNCIPVCSADEINKKTFSPNLSFISLDGENWSDLYDYAGYCHVACIKAFTQNINLTSIKMNINEFDSVGTRNFNIKVTIEDFDYIGYLDYCLVKFIIDGNGYYAQIKNGKATLNINLEPGFHTLSAQYKDNVFESNIVEFNFTVAPDYSANSFNVLHDIVGEASDKSVINLTKDYFYDENFDNAEYGIYISKTLTINGNGHSIDGLSNATIFYITADNVVLNNIVFKNAFSSNGAAVYIAGRNATLNNCSFINSKATQYGGGIYSLFDINLNNCRFINNSARMGGGLYLINTATTYIKNSSFDSNFAEIRGSAICVSGTGTCQVSSTNFTNNNATYNGGAILSSNNYNNFTDCMFFNNSANAGGAIFTNSRLVDFKKCIFSENTAVDCGGAIITYGTLNIFDSQFINNSATKVSPYSYYMLVGCAGAIYSTNVLNIYNSNFINNSAIEEGGALYTVKYLNVYNSSFIGNLAETGGASYNTASKVVKSDLIEGTVGVFLFSEACFYNSKFIDNYAKWGGAISDAYLVKNCTFVNNSAKNSGGAIYDAISIIESMFVNNSANWGGAIYRVDLVNDCDFINNSASNSGGAVHMSKNSYDVDGSRIINSRFNNNSANFGGAIYSKTDSKSDLNKVSSCNFTNNWAETSGGAVYSESSCLVEKSEFTDNSAQVGGAIFLDSNGNYVIGDSKFIKNSAIWGGAIGIYGNDNETAMAYVNITSCEFLNNFANNSGGAVYSDCNCSILGCDFTNDSARWGSAVYGRGYLDLRNSIIKSNNDTPVWFTYHYYDELKYYGNLYLKNNKIDSKYASIYYGEDEVPFKLPVYLVFNSIRAIKGQYILVGQFEDEDGNPFAPWKMPNLIVTLTDQNNRQIRLNLEYNMEFLGYYLDTSSIDYGTYALNGVLSSNGVISSYTVKPGILYISDESGRTSPVLSSPGLIKTYGQNGDLWISLKDSYGRPLANTLVRISLNGKSLSVITNANGQASLAVDLPPNTYDAYISVDGNGLYFSSAITSKVVIKKANVKVIAKKKTFKLKTKTKKYAITLKDSYGKALKNVWVKIKIKKKTFKAKTNAKGKATFKLKLNKKGKHKAIVRFTGNAYYNAVTKKVKITVKK